MSAPAMRHRRGSAALAAALLGGITLGTLVAGALRFIGF